MYDHDLVYEILEQILTASNRIERRFAGISSPDDFLFPKQVLISWMPFA